MKFLLLFLIFTHSGCAFIEKALKADPAADAGFLEHPEDLGEHRERFPFHRSWCANSNCDWSQYQQIMIAPVDTNHILKMSWWENFHTESQKELQKDLHTLAVYMKESFEEMIRNDSNPKFKLIEKPKPKTMILEMALIELVPTKAFLHAAGDIFGFIIPGGGIIGMAGSGSVAIEGRLRDVSSKKVFFQFADRETDRSAPISLADLTWHGHAKQIINDWAKEFVELLDTPSSHKVKDSSPFTLKPW